MGYYFRRSAKIGPFRLNFSKSGIGASVGVKGARLTMTPRGTTYITVGRNGFYYRETISSRSGSTNARVPSAVSPVMGSAEEISTADASDLVDSSSEALVARLNERARMLNPAWLIYSVAIVLFLIGIATMPDDTPKIPVLPMYGTEAYNALVARYGYPNTVHASRPLGMVEVRTAVYSAVSIGAVFVPSTCTSVYREVMGVLHDKPRYPALAKQREKQLRPCEAGSETFWHAISYTATDSEAELSSNDAQRRLDGRRVSMTLRHLR